MRYRFYIHAAKPAFRLVLRDGDPFPPDTAADQWTHSRDRDEADVNADVRREIAEKGYSLFKLGVSFGEVEEAIARPARH
jgi:hypothetical protein